MRFCLLFIFLLWQGASLQSQQLSHVQGDMLIQLPLDVEASQMAAILQEFQGKPTQFSIKQKVSTPANIWLYSFDTNLIEENSFLTFLRNHPLVVDAQFNHWTDQRTIPDDTYFNLQWSMYNDGSCGYEGTDINMPPAWNITTGGTTAQGDTIVVAVIDDGIDYNHPDLAENIWVNHAEIENNGIDDDNNGYVDDYYGWNVFAESDYQGIGTHGTSVASVIGAKGNNAEGIAGVNWQVKIMSLLALGGTEAEIIAAYSYALEQRLLYQETDGNEGAYVVAANSSFGIDGGIPDDAPLWCGFFDTLGENGILSIASVSNEEVNIDIAGDLPSTCTSPYLITVTSTNHFDELEAAFSSTHVDLGAPGELVMTLNQGGDVAFRSGTSFAAPAVAGAIALVYSQPCGFLGTISTNQPQYAALAVKDFILNSTTPLPSLNNKTLSGGRLNVYGALQNANILCQGCIAPVLAEVIPLPDTSLQISYVEFDTDSVVLYRRETGENNWQTESSPDSIITLSDLNPCAEYEFYFEAWCGSNFVVSETYTALSVGCCSAPLDTEWTLTSDTSAILFWSADQNTQGYTYRYKYTEESWINGPDTIFPPLSINDINACDEIQVQLAAICAGEAGDFSETIFIQSGGCGACLDEEYCESAGADSSVEYIDMVQINDLTYNTGDNQGYLLSGEFAPLIGKDSPVFLTLTPGFPVISYEENWEVWIDLNADGEFSSNELVFTQVSEEVVTGIFQLPADAVPGITRMRIMMSFAGIPALSPCELYPYGETEDYCIEIVEQTPGGNTAIECLAPETVDILEVSETDIHLSWNSTDFVNFYEINLGMPDGNTTIFTTSASEIELTELTACTDYSMTIKSDCYLAVSEPSSVFALSTDCSTSVNTYDLAIESLSVYPTLFDDFFMVSVQEAQLTSENWNLYDLRGQIVLTGTQTPGLDNFRVDVPSSLPQGVYFLTLQTEAGLLSQKLIKQ